jgi:carbonic anhydrase
VSDTAHANELASCLEEPVGRDNVAERVSVESDDDATMEPADATQDAASSRWSSFWQKAVSYAAGPTSPEDEGEEPADEEEAGYEDADPILVANEQFVADFDSGHLQRFPVQKTVVLTCMDSRIPVWEALGLQLGDAHILRNAGGIVTEDVIRSLILSHQLMGTDTVLIINHTDCGLLNLDEAGFRRKLIQSSNSLAISPAFFYSFTDLELNVREQMLRIESHPWIPEDVTVRGFVYDVRTGKLKEVEPAQDWAAVEG